MVIRAKIDVTKIIKSKMFYSTKSKAVYLDLTLLENRDGKDQYGNDGMVVQDLGKEARERKEKGPILGNFTILSKPASSASQTRSSAQPPVAGDEPPEESDVPF